MARLVERLFGLSGLVALVTGSSSGIGLALAGGLAEAGAHVVINGRNAGKVDAAVAQLRAAGAQADAAPFDVIEPADVAEAVQHIETAVGPIRHSD
jgi:gluconate 5-dehydrogenase